MANVLRKFVDHPASVGETYLEHMGRASFFGGRMVLGGLACFVHALLPFACERTASRQIATLYDRMVVNRSPTVARLREFQQPTERDRF